MLSLLLLAATAHAVAARFTPTAPGPGETFAAGSPCTIQWKADTSGKWTNVSIYLMSGTDNNMTRLTTVVSGLDGTDDTLSPYNWTCPDVNPHSAIYFYEFTNGDDLQGSEWTTRFAITSPSGDIEPPEHKTQPDGDAVPWGQGRLATHDGDADSAPTTSTNNVNKVADTPGSANSSSPSAESTSRTHRHLKSASSNAQSDTTEPDTTSTHNASRSSDRPTGTTSSAGLADASIPTAGLPAERTHSSHTRTHSSSPPSGSAAPSQMGPGVPEVGGMQLASSGRVQRRNLWPKAVTLYPLLVMLL